MRRILWAALAVLLSASACLAQDASSGATAATRSLSPADMLKRTHDQTDAMAARLAKDGGPSEDWLLLARSYLQFREFDKAKDAARQAISRKPKDIEARMVLAEAQIAGTSHAGRLPDDFVATMREVLDIDPTNGSSLYYVGLAESEAGHSSQARELWGKLLASLPADDPRRVDLNKRLEALPQ
ncbi:tetratricopeptide repeat protein [Telmatospirillum sp.]|uniref:tetratricopeptide repeat protein n=1 Tax=Telmatospirillum sp. TaxID=2079197 RepID=UPI00283E2337|nr:tetratricopeptide repeat protein [Telmatospirillum sp.]MDR3436653.1 tetratricopeptide repeat protein [Telmatospirillum sp.]